MRKLPGRLLRSVFLMLVWHLPAHGATLSGVVVEEGGPVTAAEVKLVDAENHVILKEVSTGAEGSFRFTVKPAVFDILVFKSQYANSWTRGIVVGEADVFQQIELAPKAFVEDEDTATSDDCDP